MVYKEVKGEHFPVIKIFVSRRLDIPSVTVSNPLYVPVVCGSTYAGKVDNGFIRDNTGNNISEKRNAFCEFTVEYWAWKNAEADYYGLCHYRRYLTFSSKHFYANGQEQVMEGLLETRTIKKYDLLNEERMREIIAANDVIVNQAADVNYIPTPNGYQRSVYDHWSAHDGIFFDKRVLPLLIKTIKKRCPQYYAATIEYMDDRWHRGYNCYIFRKKLFFQMCQFQFTILFDMEQQLKENGLAKHFERTLGYLGEIMYGIFVYYLQKQGIYKIREVQLVYFEQTVIPDSIWQRLCDRLLFWAKFRFEDVGYKVLPKGSKRRDIIKKIYFLLVKR